MEQRVLLIDDDTRLAEMLATYLGDRGLHLAHAPDANSGIEKIKSSDYEAVLLDIMLPDLDGFEACKRIRAISDVPILMLTARGEETDRIVGLELGADDYLPKPFNPRELLARLKAILRRTRGAKARGGRLRFGDLEIDTGARRVRVRGEARNLTAHQFDLLCVLAERAGRVQSREQIMQALKGSSLEAYDRSIDVHISRIRAAIEPDPKRPRWIQSVRGAGYIFCPPRESED